MYYTINEFCSALGVSRQAVYDLIKREVNPLRVERIGDRQFITEREFRKWGVKDGFKSRLTRRLERKGQR